MTTWTSYNVYIQDIATQNDGWEFLAIPVIGWFFAILLFGVYFPLRYLCDGGDYK